MSRPIPDAIQQLDEMGTVYFVVRTSDGKLRTRQFYKTHSDAYDQWYAEYDTGDVSIVECRVIDCVYRKSTISAQSASA